MNMKIKKLTAVILAASIATATGVLLAGCGGNKNNQTATTVPTTVAATTAKPTQSATKANGSASSQNQQSQQSRQSSDSQSSQQSQQSQPIQQGIETPFPIDADGYMYRDDVVGVIKMRAGTGAQITDMYQGYAPDGASAWVVTVIPVTNDPNSVQIIYYVNPFFCYTQDNPEYTTPVENTDNYAGVSEDYAKNVAIYYLGDPWTVISASKGLTSDGKEAWVVSMRYEVGAGQRTTNVYVGENFAYSDED